MREDFLHFIWRFKKFNWLNLQTTQGETVEVLQAGTHNTNAGPDFLEAQIRIGDTLWSGSVEIHVNASEWLAHQHQHDPAYHNVILHVVWENDKPIQRGQTNEAIPTIVLKNRVQGDLLDKYQAILHNQHWIPCQHHFFEVSQLTKSMWLERLLVERLERKTALFTEVLAQNKSNWEETFYQILARNFGGKINDEAFHTLARSIPLLTLTKHKDNPLQVQALLFGQAGLLDDNFEDSYPNSLKKEYAYLRQKHQLTPIPKSMWRFLRLRPANFPTIRIAQFATLIATSVHLFSKTIEHQTAAHWHEMFQRPLPEYWDTHYVFDKPSKDAKKILGKSTINLLLINAVVPCLFAYGSFRNEEEYKEKAIQLLETLKPEQNNIMEGWDALGLQAQNAAQSQALIELKNVYCQKQACLQCAIGNKILKG